MPQWMNKCSEFEQTSQADEKRTHSRTSGRVYPNIIISVFEQIDSWTILEQILEQF